MNITFRYGDSTEREHIDAAQEASGAIVCTYPEVGKSQREQRAWTLGVCIAGKNVSTFSLVPTSFSHSSGFVLLRTC